METQVESVTRFLETLEGEKFICLIALNKLAFSKELLAFLGFDVQEFTLQAVKFQSISHEYFPLYLGSSPPSTTLCVFAIFSIVSSWCSTMLLAEWVCLRCRQHQ
jgi:hypothetical protein